MRGKSVSHRHEPAALAESLQDFAAPERREVASFPEFAVVAWNKPRQFGATFRRYCRLYRPFFCVTLGSALFNLLVPWLGATFSRFFCGDAGFSLVLSMLVGAMLGQVAWFATWMVFGPSPYKLRWAGSILAMESLYFGLFWALGEVNGGADWAEFSILAVLPLALTSMQAPLWAWKFVSGHRLCVPDEETNSLPQRRQYRLLDILGVTAAICAATAPASLWLQWSVKTHGTATSLLAVCLSAGLIGAIAAFISAWMTSANWRSMIVGSLLIYAVVATEFAAIWSMSPAAPVKFRQFGSSLAYLSQVVAQSSLNSRFAMFWFLPCAAFVLVFHAGLLIMRAFGYRLHRARSERGKDTQVFRPPGALMTCR